jgi:integrase
VTVSDADLDLLLSVNMGFWCQPTYLKTAEALGKRHGELCAIRWIDWRAGRMMITRALIQYKDKSGQRALKFKATKGNETHSVTVPESLVPTLEAHRLEQNKHKRAFGKDYHDQDLIFCQENGDPLWPNSVSASVSFLCRRLGLPKGTSLHSLRHTHASVLLDNNVPLTVVSKRLGHANTRITAEIYAHQLRKEDDQAAAAYDDYRRKTKQQGVNDNAEIVQ